MFATKTDGPDDIRSAPAAGDQRRTSIDHPAPDGACVLITGVPGLEHTAPNSFGEGLNRRRVRNVVHQCAAPSSSDDSTCAALSDSSQILVRNHCW
jgi:hypothetical protein